MPAPSEQPIIPDGQPLDRLEAHLVAQAQSPNADTQNLLSFLVFKVTAEVIALLPDGAAHVPASDPNEALVRNACAVVRHGNALLPSAEGKNRQKIEQIVTALNQRMMSLPPVQAESSAPSSPQPRRGRSPRVPKPPKDKSSKGGGEKTSNRRKGGQSRAGGDGRADFADKEAESLDEYLAKIEAEKRFSSAEEADQMALIELLRQEALEKLFYQPMAREHFLAACASILNDDAAKGVSLQNLLNIPLIQSVSIGKAEYNTGFIKEQMRQTCVKIQDLHRSQGSDYESRLKKEVDFCISLRPSAKWAHAEVAILQTHLEYIAECDDDDAVAKSQLVRQAGEDEETFRKSLQGIEGSFTDWDIEKNTLVAANLYRVVPIARQYLQKELSLLDLIGEGKKGLIRAINRNEFPTGVDWWIQQAIKSALAIKS